MKTCHQSYPCNPLEFVKSVEGSALMITAVVVMAMVTVSAVFLNDVIHHSKLVNSYESNYRLRYAAESGLEQVKYFANTSAYTGSTNNWLQNNSLPAGKLAINDLMINNITVDITLYNLGGGWYEAVAVAGNSPVTYKVAIRIKESQIQITGPVRYALFNNDAGPVEYLLAQNNNGLADNIIRGDIYNKGRIIFGYRAQNGSIPFNYDKGITVYGNVSATEGIGAYQLSGGEADPVFNEGDLCGGTVSGSLNGWVSTLPFPTLNDMAGALQTSADDYPQYFIHSSNPLYAPYGDDAGDGPPFNLQITLLTTPGTPTQVKLEFMSNLNPGTVLNTTILELPSHKLLWVDGTAVIKGGNINGRMTIATTMAVNITDDIRYVDNDGDRMYLLKKNGVVLSPAEMDAGTQLWSAANGYTYTLNPAYNPSGPANLTIQAGNLVSVPHQDSTHNIELHANILSLGYFPFFCNHATKGNFKMIGSIAGGGAYPGANDSHYEFSTEIIHDANLLTNPPEWYPGVAYSGNTIPTYSAWRKY